MAYTNQLILNLYSEYIELVCFQILRGIWTTNLPDIPVN